MKRPVELSTPTNAIMENMMGHAYDIELFDLSDVFEDAFDPDLRNAIAHADYILAADGVRIRKRNGGQPRVISWDQFDAHFLQGSESVQLHSAICRPLCENL
jgi:hypothetical protein